MRKSKIEKIIAKSQKLAAKLQKKYRKSINKEKK